jgi:hypothetical protein
MKTKSISGIIAIVCLLTASFESYSQSALAYGTARNADKNNEARLESRNFSGEDATPQIVFLKTGMKDIRILDRALILLNKGKSWDSTDDRVCDNGKYPYQWSLFCALHQASMEEDGDYRYLRPAIQAVRQAITEVTTDKKYPYSIHDYNNEAKDFSAIENILYRAKEIIEEQLQTLSGM